ncbi:MAG: hypothetical protein EA398_04730 [Deltaproteobacteria bacterium]|nr:MAG: hypothetical protein EA398_04730 [Deltaproteobacteria bacterium]
MRGADAVGAGRGPARVCVAAAVLAVALLVALPARAQLVSVGEGPVSWELGGYLRSFSAMTEPGLAAPGEETPQARHVDLLRLEHRFFLGPRVGVEVHNRLGWTQGPAQGAGIGVDVTPAPDRSLDLRTALIDTDTTTLDHDVDRAVVRLWLDGADLAFGRQAITWGSAALFTATDFWAPFAPFELDDSQKRGIDAARAQVPLSPTTELEFVVADRGAARDVAAGVKVHHYGAVLDGWVGAARLWEQVHVAGGLRGEIGSWTLRGEGTLPVRFEEATGARSPDTGVRPPRVTVGAERFSGDFVLMLEAHWNGEGVRNREDYLARSAEPDIGRGETFWLGRAYVGGTAAWLPVPDWILTAGSFVNVLDASALLTAQVQHDVAESVEVGLGWYGGVGRGSRLVFAESGTGEPFVAGVDIGSEFGLYGHTVFLQVAAFF